MKKVLSIVAMAIIVLALSVPVNAAEKEWTWLVFLNADNNLDPFGVEDQLEMARVGSNDYLNIVSLIDRDNGPASLNYIEKDKVTMIKTVGELDMGNHMVFSNWVKEMILAYPAKHYAVIIWNHGSGWKNINDNIIKGISYDDSSGNHITTFELGLATAAIKKALGRNLDILAMDACLMQMAEVAYAVRNNVDFVVASEETEPGEGYPYDGILGSLKPSMSPEAFIKPWVAAFTASYSNGSQGDKPSTQSAIKCAAIKDLTDAIDGFAKATIAGEYAVQFKQALDRVQKFYYRTNIDLMHFVRILKDSINDSSFQTAAVKLEKALSKAIIANGSSDVSMQNANGLAIYFPTISAGFDTEYGQLTFAEDSLWDEMVQDYYKKSTNPALIAEISKGNLAGLIEYVRTANANNREVSADLISKMNFRAFTEAGVSASTQESIKTLINELKKK